MEESASPIIVGLPDETNLAADAWAKADIDAIVTGSDLTHGAFDAACRLRRAAGEAYEREEPAASLLDLLATLCFLSIADNPRAPFGRQAAGHTDDGRPFHTALPEDLTETHVAAVAAVIPRILTPVVRAQLADVLWRRERPRNVENARIAVAGYLEVARQTFSPDHWPTSERYFARAHGIASQLGRGSPEFAQVLALARDFLARLNGAEPLYYTERIVLRIANSVDDPEAESLLRQVQSVVDVALAAYDFRRARSYYDVVVRLLMQLERPQEASQFRLLRAETFVSESACASSEQQRGMSLRQARQDLLNAGAPRARIEEVDALIERAQVLAVSEMTAVPVPVTVGSLPEHARNLVRGRDPMEALWLLAGLPVLSTRSAARQAAEDHIGRFHFSASIGRRQVSHDGREQGRIPGSFGADNDDRESAILGHMREGAHYARISAVFGAIEPARRQLSYEHEYSLADMHLAIRNRPLIPTGHALLWSKGVYAGLVGEFDLAVHLLAPQLENALREALRRNGETIYTTRDGVQNLLSVEQVIGHPTANRIFGEDVLFTIDAVLAARLGANLRNDIAHGVVDDMTSNGVDAAYLWWLALYLVRFYGTDAMMPTGSSV